MKNLFSPITKKQSWCVYEVDKMTKEYYRKNRKRLLEQKKKYYNEFDKGYFVSLICKECESNFKSRKRDRKFCSLKCYHKNKIGKPSKLRGRHHTEESKRKMSEIKKRNPYIRTPESTMKLKEYNKKRKGKSYDEIYGKKKANEIKRKRSKSFKKTLKELPEDKKTFLFKKGLIPWTKGRTLEKHPSWLGGKSFEPYGVEFNNKLKEQIRKRDNYRCQECKYTQKTLGYKLPVHHIDYNKENNNPENLISLCRSCHSKTNFKREEWIKYYQAKIMYDKETVVVRV